MLQWATLCMVLFILLRTSKCNDCSSPANTNTVFSDYLSCIKDNLTENYGIFENEIFDHSRRAVQSCFAPSIQEGNQSGRCVLLLDDLDGKAWDKEGPLRQCSICQTFAKSAINALMSSQNKTEQKCIREEVLKAVAADAQYCIGQKLSGFQGNINIPDFEEGSYDHRSIVINSISNHIWVNSRLAFCKNRDSLAAQQTKQCLKRPFNNYHIKHCDAVSACNEVIPPVCKQKIDDIKMATCQCVEETRADLKERISGIAARIHDIVYGNTKNGPAIESDSKVSQCVNAIKQFVRTRQNDWIEVIDKALNKCFEQQRPVQNFGIESMISVGCRKVVADTTGTASNQLKAGFDFINNLVDAMVDRSSRFCGGEHCQ